MTSPKISLNYNKDELILRQNTAKLLAKIILHSDDMKYINLKPHSFDLMCKKLVTLIDNFQERNYPIVFGIFKFFSYMDSIIIKTYLLDFIFDILDSDKFKQIFVPKDISEAKTASKEPFGELFDTPNVQLAPQNDKDGELKKALVDPKKGSSQLKDKFKFNVFLVLDSFMVKKPKKIVLIFLGLFDETAPTAVYREREAG